MYTAEDLFWRSWEKETSCFEGWGDPITVWPWELSLTLTSEASNLASRMKLNPVRVTEVRENRGEPGGRGGQETGERRYPVRGSLFMYRKAT